MRRKYTFFFNFLFLGFFVIASNVHEIRNLFFTESNPDTLIVRKKSWNSVPYLSDTLASYISDSLRKTDSVFIKYWSNEILFVYEGEKYADLPETLVIPLLRSGEKFVFNWYGNLNWGYGPRWGKIHRGLDLYLVTGDTLVSSFDGVVRYARFNEGGYGNCVIVRHLNGLETLYGHMSAINVKENQFVKAGNLIGLGGTTGRSDGPHLHFEMRYKDFSFDPYFVIDKNTNQLLSDTAFINKSDIIYYRYPKEAPPSAKKYRKGKRKKGKYKKGKVTRSGSKYSKGKSGTYKKAVSKKNSSTTSKKSGAKTSTAKKSGTKKPVTKKTAASSTKNKSSVSKKKKTTKK